MRTSLFSDRPKSTPVHLRQMARTGRWQARCPECRAVLNRGTECGLLAALSWGTGDFAGRLIETAGLKGRRVGQAQISERHANFIVNLGGAQAKHVRQLMDLARAEVKRQFAVELIAEVKLMGEWQE